MFAWVNPKTDLFSAILETIDEVNDAPEWRVLLVPDELDQDGFLRVEQLPVDLDKQVIKCSLMCSW